MHKRILLYIIIFLTAGQSLAGQKLWTLEECLLYAEENNIKLMRSSVQTRKLESELKTRKFELLPDLGLQSQGTMNFGRSVDPETNTITFDRNITNYYFLRTGLTIFNGFVNLNSISAARYLYLSGLQTVERQRNILLLDIINAYYNVLMSKGTVRAAESQVEVSRQQLHKTEVLVETGTESRTTLLEIKSQLSNDKLLLSRAETNEGIALEELRLLLQLEPGQGFDIQGDIGPVALSVSESVDADSVYQNSKDLLPRIKSLELQKEARKKELAVKRGVLLPEVNMFAGWRTGYYDAMTEGENPAPFGEQLLNNTNQYIGVSLNIPIFKNWYYRNNIQKARLDLRDSELALRQEKNILYNEINKACFELSSLKDEYLSALDNLEYNNLSFEAVSKKFETGLANATEFAESKRALFSAEINLLAAELQYQLKEMTIKFYMTGQWGHAIPANK